MIDYEKKIKQNLIHFLEPLVLEVFNESHLHAGHGPETNNSHFHVLVVSEKFEKTSRIARHRLVYSSLKKNIEDHIHALRITALTPAEYEIKNKSS